MLKMNNVWRLWAKAIGEKAHKRDNIADQVALIRTVIFGTYLITNCFIIAGVIRHWNDQTTIEIQIHENKNYSEVLRTERWNRMGMGGDTRIEGVYSSATAKNKTGEFE